MKSQMLYERNDSIQIPSIGIVYNGRICIREWIIETMTGTRNGIIHDFVESLRPNNRQLTSVL